MTAGTRMDHPRGGSGRILAQLATVLCTVVLIRMPALSERKPALPGKDRIRIAEAFRIESQLGNRLWPGWNAAPFAILLITPREEFLIRHSQPSPDFTPCGYDSLLRSMVYVRPRTHKENFLATFPAISGSPIPTVVVGEAEKTAARASTGWVITILHEHFHQLQMSRPEYTSGVTNLGLSRGDDSGMWMLTYPFPYTSLEVQRGFARLSTTLAHCLEGRSKRTLRRSTAQFMEADSAFRREVSAKDNAYFQFQLWQEGIARYTEYWIARLAAEHYVPTGRFRTLGDFVPFREEAEKLRRGILSNLVSQGLGESGRVAFYSVGAAEGLLLDRLRPGWRDRYFPAAFSLEPLFNGTKP